MRMRRRFTADFKAKVALEAQADIRLKGGAGRTAARRDRDNYLVPPSWRRRARGHRRRERSHGGRKDLRAIR